MKYTFFTIFCLIIFSNNYSFSQLPSYYFDFQGNKYEIAKLRYTFDEAKAYAAQKKGHLVYIDSQEEQDTIIRAIIMSGVGKGYTVVPDGGGIAYLWIGATDEDVEGEWGWLGTFDQDESIPFWSGKADGKAIGNKYVNWGGRYKGTFSEPDDFDYDQDAAGIALEAWPKGSSPNSLGREGEWNDINVMNKLYFIVETEYSSINDTEHDITLSQFQNFVKLQNVMNSSISIYDVNSNKVKYYDKNTDNNLNIDIQDLATGVYFLIVNNNNIIKSFKFIKY